MTTRFPKNSEIATPPKQTQKSGLHVVKLLASNQEKGGKITGSHAHLYIYIYMYACFCICICICREVRFWTFFGGFSRVRFWTNLFFRSCLKRIQFVWFLGAKKLIKRKLGCGPGWPVCLDPKLVQNRTFTLVQNLTSKMALLIEFCCLNFL